MWVAANAQVAVNRAARIGDAWYVNPHGALPEIAEKKRRYDEIKLERSEPTAVPLFREIAIAQTRAEAVEVGREYLEPKYRQYVDWGQNEAMNDESALSQPFDRLAENRFLMGTPAEVCDQIKRYAHRLDLSHLVLRPKWSGMSYDRARESIELVGDEVIPNL